MDRTRIDERVRQMRFEGLLDRHERGELSQLETICLKLAHQNEELPI